MSSKRARLALAVVVIGAVCYAVAEITQADFQKAVVARIRRSRR